MKISKDEFRQRVKEYLRANWPNLKNVTDEEVEEWMAEGDGDYMIDGSYESYIGLGYKLENVIASTAYNMQ